MAGPKEKLPKFDGDEAADPIRHCKTCETIWRANGVTDTNEWVRQFPATLRGVAIDWFTDTDPQKLNTWDDIKKEFCAEFQILRDDNEIVNEIFNTKQKKNETVRVFARRLKDLISKMENKPGDGLQKRWFIEGLRPKLRKKMKIVPPATYTEAYNRALNLESEQKTKRKKKRSSSSDSDDDEPSGDDSSDDEDEGSSKKVRSLQKDMLRMMKEFKNMSKETKGNDLWCTECKKEGHTKGSCPKDQFCGICQIMGHSVNECPFNLKTRTPQQVFLTQEASPSGGNGNTSTEGATSGGYRNNRQGQNNSNNSSGNNNNAGRSRMQYDANGRPIVQCRACNLWGHFARECTTANTPKLLCRWCGPGDHEDARCPKSGVNLITVGKDEEEVLAITRKQAKMYPDPAEEKKRLEEARAEIQKAMQAEMAQLKDTPGTSLRNCAEQNIVRQILQTEIPVKINDLLLTMPQLRSALTNIAPAPKIPGEQSKGKEKEIVAEGEDQILLALTSGQHPAVVEMGILGHVLTDTIVDGGSGVNVLPEETWRKLGQPTLWPPKFQLLTADQHGIKPLGILMAQPVTIGTQQFLLDFVVIPLKRKGYDAILGRTWLIEARARHDWKKNTLSLESKGRRFVIDLHTQMVGEEALSSDSEGEGEGEGDDEGKKRMEPDEEGVLRLEGGSSDEDLDSLNGLFHWQIEDYEIFPSCNMLTIDGDKKEGNKCPKEHNKARGRNECPKEHNEAEGENECPKQHRQAEEGKAGMTEAEGKNIQYERIKRKDSTVRLRRKKVLCRTTDIVERCRQRRRHIIRPAQETERKGSIKVVAVQSGQVIDRPKGQLTESMVASFGNKLGDMEMTQNRRSGFQLGQWVLKHDNQNEINSGKFQMKWVGPYQLQKVGDNGAMKLWTLDEKEVADAVHRSKLNVYHGRSNAPPWTNN